MNEPPSLPSALGIEAVEWLAQGTDTITVRVRGRWRRRRPTWSGQPLLVIEVEGTRHRFPAMPEPPSLTGAAPGTWQMSFAVPASVASVAGTRAWLQLGSVVVPLPVPVEHPESTPPADEETLDQRRVRAAELAAEGAARRAAETETTVRQLQARVQELEHDLEQASALANRRRQALRSAEQRAHADRAMREELEERLAERQPSEDLVDEAEHELRIAELEEEVERLRRAADEAEHVAQAAHVARQRAELRVAELSAQRPTGTIERDLRGELDLAAGAAPAPSGARPTPVPLSADWQRLRRERQALTARTLRTAEPPGVEALRRELIERTQSEAKLRGALALLQAERHDAGPDPALRQTLDELRQELDQLRLAVERETAGRERAQLRVAYAYEAIQAVRDEIELIRSGSQARREPESGGAVEVERLAAALSRLRQTTPPPPDEAAEDAAPPEASAPEPSAPEASASEEPVVEAAPEPPAGPDVRWLGQALRTLARRDRDAAARVLAALLPASDRDAVSAARFVAAGPVRRRLRRRLARLRGTSASLSLLDERVGTPLQFGQLNVDPWSVLALAAAMIDPSWSTGQRFTIAYDAGPFLHVRGSDAAFVSDTPIGPVATTVRCPPARLPGVLAGSRPEGVEIGGEPEPLALLQEWLERAQSG